MHAIEAFISANTWAAWVALVVSFTILAKCADLFVEASVGIASALKIPKLVIGIVLVSLATTAPELAVSLMSAIKGNPEMALGNAIGSVICDDGLALALAGVFALGAIPVIPHVLRTSGLFLIGIEIVCFLLVFQDYTLSRGEGAILVLLFVCYLGFMFKQHRDGKLKADHIPDKEETAKKISGLKMFILFAIGLGGIILASDLIVASATTIARSFGIPEAVIALTLVALGTSIPEVATCIVSARKGHGDIAVGNIIGADIMNICWVAGASALANDLTLGKTPEEGAKQVYFMFPAMFVIVGLMLLLLRIKYNLTRWKGAILFGAYIVYLVLSVALF